MNDELAWLDDCPTVDIPYEDNMVHSKIKIGDRFLCGGNTWLCTDKGTRTILGINLTSAQMTTMDGKTGEKTSETVVPLDDPSLLSGPPYILAESVFDEYDQEAITLIEEEKTETNS